MTHKDCRGDYLGGQLLGIATYWFIVARFQVWALGITAFIIATLISIIHLLVLKREEL